MRLGMDQNTPNIATAISICDALGRKEMAARLERSVAAVSNAASDGAFPSGWFLIISEMCKVRGIDCPPALFTFLAPAPEFTPDKDAA